MAAKAQATGRLLSPVGDRIGFTHIPPDVEPSPDTFVAVLSTVVVCMVVFGEPGLGSKPDRSSIFSVAIDVTTRRRSCYWGVGGGGGHVPWTVSNVNITSMRDARKN